MNIGNRIQFLVAIFAMVVSQNAFSMLLNPSFETGDYTGWTLYETGTADYFGTWGIAADGQTINYLESTYDFHDGVNVEQNSPGLPHTYDATDGTYLAYQLQNGPETHRMYQDFTLAADAGILSWDMEYMNWAALIENGEGDGDGFSEDQFLAVFMRDLDDTILDTLYITYPGEPISVASMTTYSADVSAFAGQDVRLDVFMNVQEFHFDAAFDNFRITSGVSVPEPSSLLLMGIGLAGLGFVRRRKQS